MASPIIVALDYNNAKDALNFVAQIDPTLCQLKVGKELFTVAGPDLVRKLANQGYRVFLDLKYHDIPNTVAQACVAAADLGVWMMNVHSLGGSRMMEAASDALSRLGSSRPLLIAVTILTSMSDDDLHEIGIQSSAADQVITLSQLARKAGCDGVVCSAQETRKLRQTSGEDFLLVTPGIRPKGSDTGDQRRIMTPEQALQNGSDYLVIGRPVTQADDPIEALRLINTQISQLNP
ncbi:MAG TPA: orotidine-5'-phosphate decarboxylase [Gammaproteobacteria bacterium]|nr:orotidine-5'-phosphate decarboxylase [Gammaproteobacteria bacterium]